MVFKMLFALALSFVLVTGNVSAEQAIIEHEALPSDQIIEHVNAYARADDDADDADDFKSSSADDFEDELEASSHHDFSFDDKADGDTDETW